MKSTKLHFIDKSSFRWNFCSVGGSVRVKISSGEDIAHLHELDKKLWTVLSCPVNGIHFDRKTLEYLDTDNDGTIKVDEVIAASDWLASVLKNMDLLLDSSEDLPVSNIDTSTDGGISLMNTIKQMKKALDAQDSKISLKEIEDYTKLFSAGPFNGDGIITLDSCENELDRVALQACLDTIGGVPDLGGENGVGKEQVEAFYTALKDWTQWCENGKVFDEAMSKVEALEEKINDYFLRCRLIAFDENAQDVLDVSVENISAAANAGMITNATAQIISAPLARPQKTAVLPYDGINPAWSDIFSQARAAVFDKEFPSAKELTMEQWNTIEAKLEAYKSWKESKKGEQVESLGYAKAKKILDEYRKLSLLEHIAKDEAFANQLARLRELDKLIHYNRYFYRFLNNYVIFGDFFTRDSQVLSVFDEGKLYINQRCCKLCVKVEDMAAHADMAALSGMFLIYCTCTRKDMTPFNIVAALTVGNVNNLRPGMNAIFYDREGNDWNAVVTKIVDNPISMSQAFWNPYRKLANFIGDKLKKSAQEEDDKLSQNLKETSEPAKTFDIAKFAGIFAAIGMAVGYIGAFFTSIVSGMTTAGPFKTVAVIFGIMLLISAPSCFLAWIKLHRRNIGPILNANGWAINANLIINIVFGATLTSIAEYPRVSPGDPFAPEKAPWWKVVLVVLGVLAVVAIYLYFNIHE